MKPAWCPNPLPEPAIRGRLWGTPGGVYGKMGRAPWSTGGNGPVPSLCSWSLARDAPRPRWGVREAPGVKGNEDGQGPKGDGPISRGRTFLHRGPVSQPVRFGRDTALNRPSRSPLPLPAQSAEARLPLGLQVGAAAAGAFRIAPGAPGVELGSHRQLRALLSRGGRGPARSLRLRRSESGGGGSFRP